MRVTECGLPGVLLIEPDTFADERGWFRESFRTERYVAHGVPTAFAQDNFSWSNPGVLRGLHFQHPRAQGKLVSCVRGAVLDVCVDLRPQAATFGQHSALPLTAERGEQMWIPAGFAHGFLALEEGALFHYKCTVPYDPDGQLSLRWNDPELGIDWGIESPKLSPKDAAAPLLSALRPLLGA